MTLEETRAIAYRDQWDRRIAFRANQLRELSGEPSEFRRIWEVNRPIYDYSNYIANSEQQDEFFTPFDVDDPPNYSSTMVRLRGTSHAGDNSRRNA